nr:immunoglobulin light chain junction region [Macaca mulatta]MOV66001.1 immunoglobulin light chain junction region [Macaca mulatta]MOV66584.1 immunoglobulin light chain junction region [Macaca mulatta]MOV67000.1 immunoglobulin light chain junction region [Macaca mulatta]MOV67304.1 immunoglobulin light chain junction region [Macaca mulatta]
DYYCHSYDSSLSGVLF